MTPEEQAQNLLYQTSIEDLLTKFAALTHRIHAAEADQHGFRSLRGVELRAQRDLIKTEIIRRTEQVK